MCLTGIFRGNCPTAACRRRLRHRLPWQAGDRHRKPLLLRGAGRRAQHGRAAGGAAGGPNPLPCAVCALWGCGLPRTLRYRLSACLQGRRRAKHGRQELVGHVPPCCIVLPTGRRPSRTATFASSSAPTSRRAASTSRWGSQACALRQTGSRQHSRRACGLPVASLARRPPHPTPHLAEHRTPAAPQPRCSPAALQFRCPHRELPQGLPYVINMTLPDRSEDYIHR